MPKPKITKILVIATISLFLLSLVFVLIWWAYAGTLIVEVQCSSGKKLGFYNHTYIGGSYYIRDTIVRYDGKTIYSTNGDRDKQFSYKLPTLRDTAPNLVYTKIPNNNSFENIFINTDQFSQSDYNNIASCYQNNQTYIEGRLANFKDPIFEQSLYINSFNAIIYSSPFSKSIFQCPENLQLTVDVDGRWSVSSQSGDTYIEGSQKGISGYGKIENTEAGNKLKFIVTSDERSLNYIKSEGKTKEESDNFFRVCTDSKGQKIDQIYDYAIETIKPYKYNYSN
jgi:hypothetical protein